MARSWSSEYWHTTNQNAEGGGGEEHDLNLFNILYIKITFLFWFPISIFLKIRIHTPHSSLALLTSFEFHSPFCWHHVIYGVDVLCTNMDCACFPCWLLTCEHAVHAMYHIFVHLPPPSSSLSNNDIPFYFLWKSQCQSTVSSCENTKLLYFGNAHLPLYDLISLIQIILFLCLSSFLCYHYKYFSPSYEEPLCFLNQC